jgi:MFS family permease
VTLLSESSEIRPIHRKILAFSFIGWVFDFYDLMLLSFLVASTSLMRDLALSRYDVSVLLGIGVAFTAVGGLVGGSLADRFGRKPILMLSILMYSFGTLLSGLAHGMGWFLIARSITGVGVGAEWAVAHALVGETVPPHVRGRYGSYLQSGGTFGRFLATLVGNFLAPWIGWRLSFIVSALPALIVVFIRRQMPESDVWLSQQQARRSTWGDQIGVLGQMIGRRLRKTTGLALTFTTLTMAAFWFKMIWLPTYYHEIRGLSLGDSARLLSVDYLGSLIGYVSFGFLSDRFGRRPSFALFSLIKAAGLIMITLGWNTVAQSPWLYGFALIGGIGEGNFGCIGPLLSELFPTSARATALGIIYNSARGTQFLAPVVIAFVAARVSFGAGIALAAPFALLAGASVFLLPETKGIRLVSDIGSVVPSDAPTSAASAPPKAATSEV